MAEPLTSSQRRVLDFLRESVTRNRFAPTAKEVAARFGIAEKNAFYYLEVLERKGHIRRRPHHPRRIEFTGEPLPRPPVRVPVLGRVPAGSPREAIEHVEEELFLDPALAGEGEVFSLRVKGDSMVGAHICEGDYVLVRAQADAADGEIVVAVVDGEATVKRLRREKGRIRLEAANPAYPPIVVPGRAARAFRIAGKVVGVFRRI
ncbi:MAG: repressor LexA [Deltaproteobacteria bacterium]|nr:MAG: repressor LexA [Deltaproteobacteria bacterium]